MWDTVVQVSVVLAGMAAGGTVIVPTINYIKDSFNLSGAWVNVVVALFAGIITLATAVVEGTLSPGAVNSQTWGALLLAIVFQAEVRYRQLKDKM